VNTLAVAIQIKDEVADNFYNTRIKKPMGKRVIIDTEECIGCQSCVELCPEVFGFDDDAEKANVILYEDGNEECIDEAISSCPSECIHWEQ
jgi:ferredoxin